MTWDALIHLTIRLWQRRQFRIQSEKAYQRILRQNPVLRKYEIEEEKARRGHKRFSHIQAARKAAVTQILKGGQS